VRVRVFKNGRVRGTGEEQESSLVLDTVDGELCSMNTYTDDSDVDTETRGQLDCCCLRGGISTAETSKQE